MKKFKLFSNIIGCIILIFVIFNYAFTSEQSVDKLSITGHIMTVYDDQCVIDYAISHPYDLIIDLEQNIDPSCKRPEIKSISEDYAYLFVFNLNNPKSTAKSANIRLIGIVDKTPNQILAQNVFEIMPGEDTLYLFIGGIHIKNSQVITIEATLLDINGNVADVYSFKIPMIDTKHGRS